MKGRRSQKRNSLKYTQNTGEFYLQYIYLFVPYEVQSNKLENIHLCNGSEWVKLDRPTYVFATRYLFSTSQWIWISLFFRSLFYDTSQPDDSGTDENCKLLAWKASASISHIYAKYCLVCLVWCVLFNFFPLFLLAALCLFELALLEIDRVNDLPATHRCEQIVQ